MIPGRFQPAPRHQGPRLIEAGPFEPVKSSHSARVGLHLKVEATGIDFFTSSFGPASESVNRYRGVQGGKPVVPRVPADDATPIDPSVPPELISDVEVGVLTVGRDALDALDTLGEDVVDEPRVEEPEVEPTVDPLVPIDPADDEPMELEAPVVAVEPSAPALVPELRVDDVDVGEVRLDAGELESVEVEPVVPRLEVPSELVDVDDTEPEVGIHGRIGAL
jgi:hypothetical protein